MKLLTWFLPWLVLAAPAAGHPFSYEEDPFRQLDEILPDPNGVRAANGAPGPAYWQQRADYQIAVRLDDEKQRLTGSETITYTNNSPLELAYLWVQLDQNRFEAGALGHQSREAPDFREFDYRRLRDELTRAEFDGGYEITKVADAGGKPLEHTIVDTMMRIELPEPLPPGGVVGIGIDWEYAVVNAKHVRARGGYEYFEDDGNYLYTIAQWYPRVAAFTDVTGWQHKQFLGRGEFALEFGDYEVAITVPDDHLVASTGVLQNAPEVLSVKQRERLARAESSAKPMFIVTPEEAKANEESKPAGMKTWRFRAERVRDFAWASSRKFIWDAARVEVGEKKVWAMSFYPKEGEPLWSRFSTHAVLHTLDFYSRYVFEYPYPVAISVHGPVYGMEYPMICFNGPRPEDDGTYSRRTKYGLISVVIHEVGHNWFPMIVNSDERQWTWMDEGLNTFVQFLAEQEWEEKYPSRSGHPPKITGYMKDKDTVPIMTNSESLKNFGANAYAKPAAALNVLRETIMGRENFDYAFREYANRWAFKRPMPADLFRSMEDASGVDLDWFWRGWFYTTGHVDAGIKRVRLYELDTRDPDRERPKDREEKREKEDKQLTNRRNEGMARYTDRWPELLDFYNNYDEFEVTDKDREEFREMLEELEEDEKELLETKRYFYAVEFDNPGGLPTPLILRVTYDDDESEIVRHPAEIWKKDLGEVTRLMVTKRKIKSIELDPFLETADTDVNNNHWPAKAEELSFSLLKKKRRNLMQEKAEEEAGDNGDGGETEKAGETP
ncbi:MAG: M1 family metallopeptidase [Akkermansiaceae bacterium]|nr:M1 family metallopeptidase [Akkermansiaceae bacterium]NNM30362.1 M1 family metallopeptidase [Akkermansiaceae bacterium]